MTYTLSDFDFELPTSLIAQTPARPRDHARLLIYDRISGAITDDYFYNLEKYLPAKTTIVLNNSKVEKCRLRFGKVELFVAETINPTTVRALVRPGKKFNLVKPFVLEIDEHRFIFTTTEIDGSGVRTITLDRPIDDSSFDAYRATPLPPYIKPNEALSADYQTVYAKPLGSRAAPTAGLHFTHSQLKELASRHTVAQLTLHVGLGTFAPVKVDDITKHIMHSEYFEVSAKTAKIINQASHITAVGTTSARTLESLKLPLISQHGKTSIFITPGYKFKLVDSLITNFHLPKSTLLMLVAAHIGSVEELKRIYNHAIAHHYRFYSFGDAMLLV